MTEDVQLLGCYAAEGSEAAFAEFTRRNVDLVYSAALRMVNGDVHSAQDVTQQVFTEVARQAKRLTRHPALVGWLYTTTRQIALRVIRTEQRRKAREQEAHTMNELLHDDAPSDWNQLRPMIEDVMLELDDKDRHAVLLRFFQNKSLNEVGAALNLTDNAARMRVERALEKLREKLARRGIATTSAGLAALVSANAVHAAPAGFVATLSAAALAGSTVPATAVIAATQTLAMTTLQKAIVAAALTTVLGTGIYAVRHNSDLETRIQTLQQDQAPLADQIKRLERERLQSSNQLAALSEENARLRSSQTSTDLLRLRGEVGTLRQRVAAEKTKPNEPTGGLAKMMSDPAMKEYMQKAMSDKMKSLYSDLTKELKLTPEQTDQLIGLLSGAATKSLAQLTAGGPNSPDAGGTQEMGMQLRALLGDAGCVRLKEYSEEMPARATLQLLNKDLEAYPLTDRQSKELIQIIQAEPAELTRGIIGAPDKAFMGSQADVDAFLQQVSDSNQRILEHAGGLLTPEQLGALNSVLTKGIESRRLQGAAFFPRH